jgi:hypothetical protein
MSETEPTPAAPPPAVPAPTSTTTETPPPEVLARALKAFKKRLKLTQLDDVSRISVSPMSNGRPSGIVAITPPNDYPRAVWDALVAQGRLKKVSQGQYELVRP